MADRIDELEQEIVVGLLRAWIDVYRKGQAIYDSMPDEGKALVNEHGYRVEGFVPVVAFMQPEARAVCRRLVEDALAAALSQPLATVDAATDEVVQAKTGGAEAFSVAEERDLAGEIEELRAELAALRRLLEHHLATCPGAESALEDQRPPTEES